MAAKGLFNSILMLKVKRMPNMSDDFESPVDGYDLQLTIDTKIQSIVERELDNAEALYNPDGMIVIAMNPNNGEILAMSSRPSFNPADFRMCRKKFIIETCQFGVPLNLDLLLKSLPLRLPLKKVLVDLEDDHFHDRGM